MSSVKCDNEANDSLRTIIINEHSDTSIHYNNYTMNVDFQKVIDLTMKTVNNDPQAKSFLLSKGATIAKSYVIASRD